MKTIEHLKGFTPCRHSARDWYVALAGTLACTRTNASFPDMQEIVKSLSTGQAVWHRGILLTGDER